MPRANLARFLPIQDFNMSRQDANAAFARTSFLYGGNAPYIEDLYARYLDITDSFVDSRPSTTSL